MIVLQRIHADGSLENRNVVGKLFAIMREEAEIPHTLIFDDRGYLANPPEHGRIEIGEDN